MPKPSSGPDFNYRAFISYSHRDKRWADWLHKALETYRVPKRLVGQRGEAGRIPRRLNPVFRDRDELASDTDLGRRINEALAASETLVVICSPAAAASRWVNEEVLAYKRLGRDERIFCLIVAGEPNASEMVGREAEECFCPALRFKLDANGEVTAEPTEPIAADARAGNDGKTNAKLKLIAGILGVGFDALKQRDQRRKMHRMIATTSTAVAIMCITIALAVFGLVSRHQAMAAKHTAQHRQKQAEDLVNFMLGDLTNKLWKVGRVDIMQAVNKKAMAYFASLSATDVNATELEERANALEKIGGLRYQSNDLSGALKAFRASARISSRLAAAAPDNFARQVAYSRTLAFIGDIYLDQDKLVEARHTLEQARRVLHPAVKRAPNDLSALVQLFYVDNDLGQTLDRLGRTRTAESDFREGLTVTRRLVAARPDKAQYAQALGGAHDDLARLALERGDLANAVSQRRAADGVESKASSREPKNNFQRAYALEARASLGNTLALIGRQASATRDVKQAVDAAAQLVKAAPHNSLYRSDFRAFSALLATFERLNGELPAAEAQNAKARALLAAYTAKNPSDSTAQHNYADALVEHALELKAAGKADEAETTVRKALQILGPLVAKNSRNLGRQQSMMRAKLLLASLETDAGRAAALREQALQALQAAPLPRNSPIFKGLEVEALLALGRRSEAQPLIDQLWNEGYRYAAFVAALRRHHIAYPPNPSFGKKLLAATTRIDAADTAAAAPVTSKNILRADPRPKASANRRSSAAPAPTTAHD